MDNLENKTLQELEDIYARAVIRGDELIADIVTYLISEKQAQLVKEEGACS